MVQRHCGAGLQRLKACACALQDVEEKMHALHLPVWLKRKIRGYYAFRWMPDTGKHWRFEPCVLPYSAPRFAIVVWVVCTVLS